MRALTTTRAIFLAFLLVPSTTACRTPMPCPDCDSADDVHDNDMPKDPGPDLPCGGADLQTDPRNCGTCDNDCLWFPGTEWEVGSCQMGVCTGPVWSRCAWEAYGATCAEICAGEDKNCVAKGCSGHTALLYWNSGDLDHCEIPSNTPYTTMFGSCDEPIPWEHDGGARTHARCCCEY
jgi:hypothetical protein